MLQTMTSRYIDTQLFTVRVCAFVSVCVCVCKESSETTESRMKIPCEGALNGLTRQR